MREIRKTAALATLAALTLACCAAAPRKPLVDPFPLRFPLVETGTLEIEGHVVGQPRAQGDIFYYATREGALAAVVVPSRALLSLFQADHPLTTSPEIVGDTVLLRDDADVFYVLSGRAKGAVSKYELDPGDVATTPVRLIEGGYILGTADGRIVALESWEYRPSGPGAEVTCGPIPVWREGGLKSIVFGRSDGLVMALSPKGKPLWEFRAKGAVQAQTILGRGRVYFGDSKRMFYCLDAGSGKVKWRRRLQGVPVHPAAFAGGRIAVAASNSVVYRLSRKGGSILSWEAVPSRIIYELAAAGPLVLVTSASPTVTALDLRTGTIAGQYQASGSLVAGAVWSPPYVVLVVEDETTGRQRLVFLSSSPGGTGGPRKPSIPAPQLK
jgi:outer membrane protein assembly factor BamB